MEAAAAAHAPAPQPLVVREGDTVIFDINGEKQAFVTIDAKSTIKLGRAFCPAAPLIGCPYGAMFTLSADGKSLERTAYVPSADWDLPTPDVAPDFNTRTNAELRDGGDDNQALSAADIEAMKAAGAGGADIVAALTANSATFAAKTEFSQEKYRKKKARKYIQVGTVRRPTGAAVCEAYFLNAPSKTNYLRVDALALLLSFANVGAHARVLVVEACGGMITAAVAERLGEATPAPAGGGGVCSAWLGAKRPPLDIWRSMNLSAAQRAGIRFVPLRELLEEARQAGQQAPQQAQQAQPQQGGAQPAAGAAQQQEGTQERQPEAGAAAGAADSAAAAAAQQAPPLRPPFNSCILAPAGVAPLALVRHVLPLLAPSASLAVLCPWQHPLAEALDGLRGQGQVANLALHEAWWRQQQVLPLRTHPNMNMNHGGGFILTGTVLAPRQQK